MDMLIVEDDTESANMMKEYLKEYGTADIAIDGENAIKKIEGKKKYDLIFIDVILPDFNGIELLRRLREYEKKNSNQTEGRIKVIMVSSSEEQKFILDSKELKCDDYLIKPLNLTVLDKIMKNLKVEILKSRMR